MDTSTDFRFVYVTCPDSDTARRLGSLAIERRLAACANILPEIQSLFRWEGAVQSAGETVLILKTKRQRYAALQEVLCAEHPYSCPCIVALPITAGHGAFLNWIDDETVE